MSRTCVPTSTKRSPTCDRIDRAMSNAGPPEDRSGVPADARAEGAGGRRGRRDQNTAPPPWEPQGPTTQTLEVLRGRLPLSIKMIGRSSVPGAILVLAIALVFVGVIPLAAKLQLNAAQASGDEIPVGNYVQITVANDWAIESQDGRATVLSSGSSHLVIVPAYPETRTAGNVALAEVSARAEAGSGSWVVGELTSFRTEDGLPGATMAASSETAATQVWAVAHDGFMTVAVLNSTIESWNTAQARAQEMVGSIVFADIDAGGAP